MSNIEVILGVISVIIFPLLGMLIKVIIDYTTLKQRFTDLVEDMKEQKKQTEENKTGLTELTTDHKILKSTLSNDIKTIQTILVDLVADVKTLIKEKT